jgi:hypothetical protein
MAYINARFLLRAMKCHKIPSYYVPLAVRFIFKQENASASALWYAPRFQQTRWKLLQQSASICMGVHIPLWRTAWSAVRAKLKWYGEGLEWSPKARFTERTNSTLVTICSMANLPVNNRAHCGLHTSPTRLLSSFIWHYHNPSTLASLFN